MSKYLISIFIASLCFSNSYATSNEIYLAKKIYERVTGAKVRISDPVVLQIAQLLKDKKFEAAVKLATEQPQFINVNARNFSLGLSTKNGNLNTPFNDTALLILGTIRDDLDFRKILTDNYRYEIEANQLSRNPASAFYLTESYNTIDAQIPNYYETLKKVSSVNIISSINVSEATYQNKLVPFVQENLENAYQSRPHPDPAGVFSTAYFGKQYLSGGTNRRPVEYAVNAFLCTSMSEIGNSQTSDAYVGRDIDRFPSGSHNVYTTNCKSCHTVLDGFRGAFAKTSYDGLVNIFAGFSALSYGDSSIAQINANRSNWIDQFYSEKDLAVEAREKGTASLLYKELLRSENLNLFIGDRADDKAKDIALFNKVSAASRFEKSYSARRLFFWDKVPAPQIFTLIESYGFRQLALKDGAKGKPYVTANINAAWLQELDRLNYLLVFGKYLLSSLIYEVEKMPGMPIQKILENGASTHNINTYSASCTIKKTVRDFLICEANYNKANSFLIKKIISNLSVNGASDILKNFTMAHLTTPTGMGLMSNSFPNYERSILFAYINNIRQSTYFATGSFDSNGITKKMNISLSDVGYVTTSDQYHNLASASYGWRGPNSSGGTGMADFGRTISDSETFSKCIVKKLVKTLCLTDVSMSSPDVKKLAIEFENGGYKIKQLVPKIVEHQLCGVSDGK